MRHRTQEECEEKVREAARLDSAMLKKVGLTVTRELVDALARSWADGVMAAADQSMPDFERPWAAYPLPPKQ